MSYEISGVLTTINATQTINDKFRKREFVLEHMPEQKGNYAPKPQFVKFEVSGERCDDLDAFAPGQDISVKFDIEGRAWVNPKGETVYFNTLRAWALFQTRAQKDGQPTAPKAQKSQIMPEPKTIEDDDMPF